MRNNPSRVTLILLAIFLTTASCFASDKPDPDRFKPVDAVIQQAIDSNYIPGAVLMVGHKGSMVYQKAYGMRSLEPTREPMTLDTIFDCASLTKVVVTTTAMMQMLQQGKVRLNDPVSKYLPDFGANGKSEITIRQLMTHFSGLREDLDLKNKWLGKDTAWQMIVAETPVTPPGAMFRYSDINFETLGFLIEKLNGQTLDEYATQHIFKPLKMDDSTFLPPKSWLARIAPTEYDENNVMLDGVVHDPTARRMGGIAGHAGLFSTARDLAIFSQVLLDGEKILSPLLIEKMTTPQQPAVSTNLRGLGWDLDTPFSSNRGELLPVGSYGHTGFTGTSIWIDPYSKTYIILMTNAVHPRIGTESWGKIAIRTKVATAVTDALKLKLSDSDEERLLSITGYNEQAAAGRRPLARNGHVLNGIDVLEKAEFAPLKHGRDVTRIGLLTNQTGLTVDGRRTVDVLAHADGIKLAVLFSPEHGVFGTLDTTKIGDSKDEATGANIYSVYGATDAERHPKQEWFKDLDAVVIDIQDVGARFWTYGTSVGYFLEAAAKAGVEIYVLDRPNPVSGTYVQGPVSDTRETFVNYSQIPTRHGMTLGELASMYNTERKINAKLTVVPMQEWRRGDWFDSTGQVWLSPSPNMRSLNEATLYTGVAEVEGTNVSVGRGTETPFEVLGAPWITREKAREFADYLNARDISGVRFVPTMFTPKSAMYANQLCGGVNIFVTDRYALDAPEMGVELASALMKFFPNDYKVERMIELLNNNAAFDALRAGSDPRRIADDWRDKLEEFQKVRQKYLFYK
jgi:uncharacterized protein YbbC (DUF1343 family)/CubicO group peptidase (beta-lactamase class C family)